MNIQRTFKSLAASAALIGLAACSADPATNDETQVEVADTVLEAINASGDHTRLAEALEQTGLNTVFEGQGSYTIFAPTDDAFAALSADDSLLDDENRALLAAMIRNHMLTGHLTSDAIKQAADGNGGTVTMKSLGSAEIRLRSSDDGLSVVMPDGNAVAITSAASESQNGVVIPVSALLSEPQPAQ